MGNGSIIRRRSVHAILGGMLIAGIALSVVRIVSATAPNPGHNFNEVGGGAVQGDLLYGSAADTLAALPKDTSTSRYLSNSGSSNNPAWSKVDVTNGVTGALAVVNGGTGFSGFSNGDLMVGSSTGSLLRLADVASGQALISGGVGSAPAYGTLSVGGGGTGAISLTGVLIGNGTSAVTATSLLTSANGGTGNGFFAVSGPTTSTKTFTFPDASATVLTTNAAVTVAQGGTGLGSGTSGGIPYYSGTTSIASSAALTASAIVLGGGAGFSPTVLGSLGTTTTVLHGNASGAPSFGSVSLTGDITGTLGKGNGGTGTANTGYILKGIQVFISGTDVLYTTPSGVNAIYVCVTGSGGEGGCSAGSANNAGGAGGGGSGATTCKLITSPSATYHYTVGAAPSLCTAGNNAGNNGNQSCIGTGSVACTSSTLAAAGGTGGSGSGAAANTGNVVNGGAGGTVTTAGDITMPGQGGIFGVRESGAIACGGTGGASHWGGGGLGGGGTACTTSSGGTAGGNYGAGGGGAASIGNSNQQGAAGAAGLVTIYEYY